MHPKRPKFGLFSEKFSLGVFCLCPPSVRAQNEWSLRGTYRLKYVANRLEIGCNWLVGSSAKGLPARSLPVRRCVAGNSRSQAAKRPRRFIMRRAAPIGTPTHGGCLEAPDATLGWSIACVVAELRRVFAAWARGGEGRREREGEEEGGREGERGRKGEKGGEGAGSLLADISALTVDFCVVPTADFCVAGRAEHA